MKYGEREMLSVILLITIVFLEIKCVSALFSNDKKSSILTQEDKISSFLQNNVGEGNPLGCVNDFSKILKNTQNNILSSFFDSFKKDNCSVKESDLRAPETLQAMILNYYTSEEGAQKLIRLCLYEYNDLTEIPPTELLVLFNLFHENKDKANVLKTKILAAYPVLWSLTRIKRSLKGHLGPIKKAVFFQDTSLLATCSDDETVIIWDTEDASEIAQLILGPIEKISSYTPATNNHLLIGTKTGKYILFDYRKKKILYPQYLLSGPIIDMCTVSKQKLISLLFSNLLVLFDPEDPRFFNDDPMDNNESNEPRDLGFTPLVVETASEKGRPLLAYSYQRNLIAVVEKNNCIAIFSSANASQLARVATLVHATRVSHFVFSPDGKLLAVASVNGKILFWNMEQYNQAGDFFWESGEQTGLCWLGSSRYLVSINNCGLLVVWDYCGLNKKNMFFRLDIFSDPGRAYTCIAVTTDGATCALGDNHGLVWLWKTPYNLSIEQLLLLILLFKNQKVMLQEFSPYWQELYAQLDNPLKTHLQNLRTSRFVKQECQNAFKQDEICMKKNDKRDL